MKRADLEHIIRAAGSIADDDIIILGSQAILATAPEAPTAMLRSVEADVYPKAKPENSIVIDGAIGEGSPFHDTFGYYAHGVGPDTAVLPDEWRARLIPLRNENTRGHTGWCLDPIDLAVSKLIAGREHDVEFLTAGIAAGIFDAASIRSRLSSTSCDRELIVLAEQRLDRLLMALPQAKRTNG